MVVVVVARAHEMNNEPSLVAVLHHFLHAVLPIARIASRVMAQMETLLLPISLAGVGHLLLYSSTFAIHLFPLRSLRRMLLPLLLSFDEYLPQRFFHHGRPDKGHVRPSTSMSQADRPGKVAFIL